MGNITMQQLKQQRATPAERFVLETISGVKSDAPDEDGNVDWYCKDGNWLLIQDFKHSKLWVSNFIIYAVLGEKYGLNSYETEQLLTKLLYKYTNNGQLKIS